MRLIDANELTEMVWRERVDSRERIAELIARQPTIKAPTADVQSVKHGRWTDNVYKYVKSLDAYFIQAKCSVCGRYSDRIDIYSRFMSNECCSRCGARMGGDESG